MPPNFSFSPKALYRNPLVLKNFRTGSALIATHRRSSSSEGRAVAMSRNSASTPCSANHLTARRQVSHFG